ncbi:acetylglutamate kinase [Streptococcus pneumoniae]|nr:acetylglutamate kinase [Streptococcus pneumoniae]
MKAQKLILMTDVQGVIEHGTLIKRLNISDVQSKIDNRIITGGMIPKVESAVATIKAGVNEVIIGNNLLTGTIIEGNNK